VTRVLYWNIEKFALNKIANPVTKKRKSGSSVPESEASADRRSCIQQVITAAAPDVIVVIEISTVYQGNGRLATGAGLDGCFELLDAIRTWLGDDANDPSWMLVPPLQTGPKEAVAVFYDSANRYFSGPSVWPGGAAGVSAAPPTVSGAYPADIRTRLPDRTVPNDSLHNSGRAERRCAARTAFVQRAGLPDAGDPVDWNGRRSPYMVTFAETDANDDFERNLTLFAIHSPAKIWLAPDYLQTTLPTVAEIVDDLDDDEVRVIVGDFNVNLMRRTDLSESPAYDGLQTTGNYDLALAPVDDPPDPPEGYTSYFATHVRGQFTAGCWSLGALFTAYYPGYDYVGSDKLSNTYAIDNVFTLYGANLDPPDPNNFTILNPIVGSPFTAHPLPDPDTPTGTVALARQVPVPPPAVAPAQGPAFSIGLKRKFQSWLNYGRVRSTSDHFALVIDV
jgi:hypothetical protein